MWFLYAKYERDEIHVDFVDNLIYKGDDNEIYVIVKGDLVKKDRLHLLTLEGDRPYIYMPQHVKLMLSNNNDCDILSLKS